MTTPFPAILEKLIVVVFTGAMLLLFALVVYLVFVMPDPPIFHP